MRLAASPAFSCRVLMWSGCSALLLVISVASSVRDLEFTPQRDMKVGTRTAVLSKAIVEWSNVNRSTEAFKLDLLSQHESAQILQHIKLFHDFSFEADTVDGAPAYEAYLVQDVLGQNVLPTLDTESKSQRDRLLDLTAPLVAERLVPFVNEHYASVCLGQCRVCSSLVRRYKDGERRVVNEHHDLDAMVTVVISLNDVGNDFKGGIYVSAGGARQDVPLQAGEALIHQTDLFHGVDVLHGERWSWINWFERKKCKSEDSTSWYQGAADTGDPVAQYIMYIHAKSAEGRTGGDSANFKRKLGPKKALAYLAKSAKQGFLPAVFSLGHEYALGGMGLQQNETKGMGLIRKAAKGSDRNALLFLGMHYGNKQNLVKAKEFLQSKVLEGDRQAHFALGMIAQLTGSLKEAAEHFEASGSAEAFAHRANVEIALGYEADSARVLSWVAKAARMGSNEACDAYRKSPRPEPRVVIDCVAVQGHGDGFNALLNDVFPKLKLQDDRIYAMRMLRSMAATLRDPDVGRRLQNLAKKHHIEL